MKRLRRALLVLAASLAATTIVLVVRTLIATGMFTRVPHQFAGSCMAVDGAVQDLVTDRKDGLVFASRADGIAVASSGHLERGFDAVSGAPKGLRPFGLGLYEPAEGPAVLAVVDRPKDEDPSIEEFEIGVVEAKVTLTQKSRIAGGLLRDPGAVVPVGPDQFYATNGSTSRTSLGRFLEVFAGVPRGNIVFFDGNSFRVVVEGFSGAAGIEVSEDGTHLYAGTGLDRTLYAFERNPVTGDLKQAKDLPLGVAIAALHRDGDANLWIAGYPDIIEFSHDKTKARPSEIFRVSTKVGIPDRADLVFADAGQRISGARTAAAANGELAIGSPFGPSTLICKPAR